MWGGWHYKGDLFSAFKETKKCQGGLKALADGQITLIQSNQYATVGFGEQPVLGSDPSGPFYFINVFIFRKELNFQFQDDGFFLLLIKMIHYRHYMSCF